MGQHQRLARRLGDTMTSFEHLVADRAPCSIEELSRARIVLVQAVNGYFAHFGELVARMERSAASILWREEYARLAALRGAYSAHIGRYPAGTIESDWSGYRQGCLDLLDATRAHIAEVVGRAPLD